MTVGEPCALSDPGHLAPGEAVTLWAMSAPEELLFAGDPRPQRDTVDYRFVNGWVDTGDLPCREALRASLPNRTVVKPSGPFDRIHPGIDGQDVDYSTFRHRPTLIRRGFRTELAAEAGGTVRFRVATCGGVYLWLGERQVAAFGPFERNSPQQAEFAFDVDAGPQTLTLLLEDLHERDTMAFFSLVFQDGPPISATPPGLDRDRLAAAVGTLEALTPDHVFAAEGTVCLTGLDETPDPLRLRTDVGPFPRGGLSVDPDDRIATETVLTDAGAIPIFEVDNDHRGCLSIDIELDAGDATLSRRLGFTALPPATRLDGPLETRKVQAADLIAEGAGFDPSVAALLAIRAEQPDRVARILDATLPTIEERHDCSDFSILPLLRLWRDARDTLDDARRDRLRAAFLNFRYWIDEPGNDVMWFWSENHVLCFHAAQMIAGGLFPDEVFPNSGKTGRQHRAAAKARLHRWFASIRAHGLCEWNSAAYYPIDLLALFTLHDMEPTFRQDSAFVMDRLFAMVGLHTSGDVPAGSQGRCYEKELLSGPANELGPVAAIAFGGAFHTGFDRAAALFCMSDYAPPAEAARFARPAPDEVIEAAYTQGLNHVGKLRLWKSAAGQLSTATDLATGGEGHQAQVLDVQLSAHPMARLWINHPGDPKIWGERRPSLLAGNHVMPRAAQVRNTGLLIYDLDRPWTDLPFTQVFAAKNAFDRIETHGAWTVYSAGDGHVAVWCALPLQPVTGVYAGSLFRAMGRKVGWVVTMSQPGEDCHTFCRRLADVLPTFDPGALRLSLHLDGREVSLSFDGPQTVDGAPVPFAPLTPVPHVSINGSDLTTWKAENV